MVADRLDALCSDFPSCMAVAYADLSINMVLVTNSGADLSREVLDELCTEAALTLGSEADARLGSDIMRAAYTASPDQTKVFIRDTGEPNDVLLCLCAPDVDMTAFAPAAIACLAQLGAGDA